MKSICKRLFTLILLGSLVTPTLQYAGKGSLLTLVAAGVCLLGDHNAKKGLEDSSQVSPCKPKQIPPLKNALSDIDKGNRVDLNTVSNFVDLCHTLDQYNQALNDDRNDNSLNDIKNKARQAIQETIKPMELYVTYTTRRPTLQFLAALCGVFSGMLWLAGC